MALATRRERREKQKQKQRQRQRRDTSSRVNGLLIGAVAIGVVVLAILLLRAAGVFEPPPALIDISDPKYQVSGQTIGTLQPDQGAGHIPTGQPGRYATDPPTSGEHWSSSSPAAPAPWGIKDATLPREVTVHNLEHGGIVIMYNNLSPAEIDRLKSVVRALNNGAFRKIVLEPYPNLGEAKVALTAWRWLLKLQSVDEIQIVQFVRAHYSDPNYAPEANLQ